MDWKVVRGYLDGAFPIQRGTLAELVSVPVRCVATQPAELGWLEAAALPLAGLTAYQCIHEGLGVRPDGRVLVHVVSGGGGSCAGKLSVHAGAAGVRTASPPNHDSLLSFGAQPVRYG